MSHCFFCYWLTQVILFKGPLNRLLLQFISKCLLTICLYCVFKATEKCIRSENAEYIQSSSEHKVYAEKDSRHSFLPHQNELSRASEKAQNSTVKILTATDAGVPKTDVMVITRRESTEPCSTRGTFERGNTQKTSGEVPHLPVDAVEPKRDEAVLNKHRLFEPGTRQGSYRSVNREKRLDKMPSSPVSDDRLQCSVCGFVFKHQRYLVKHMTIHTGKKPFKCSFCDQKFRTKHQHKMHELRHKGELPQCPVCGGRYVNLTKHIRIHSTDSYKHVCSVCQKAFRLAYNLKSHMLVHTGERPYTCLDCGGRYKTSTQLKLHIRAVHAGEKNHVCSDCGKKFSQREGLNAHMSIHSDEKPYHCETCGKAFKRKVGLEKHQTIHSSEKPFICSTCGKGFRRTYAFYRHRLIHTGEQPYECSMCKMRFNQSNSMQRHMLTHTGEKPYSCSDCGERFTQSGGLASHRLRHCPSGRNTVS